MTADEGLVQKTADFLIAKFANEASGHDWWHMYRTWQLAKTIAKEERSADMLVVELGALLHDIDDWKFNDGDIEAGATAARTWLSSIGTPERIIVQIEEIIRTISFKGANVAQKMSTLEGKIVHDADKLDSIGAIGIGRTFAYGGTVGRPMYDPERKNELHDSFNAYKASNSPTISHFYEKLLLLKDRMYTETGKKIAESRHAYMEKFLEEFHAEWEGKK